MSPQYRKKPVVIEATQWFKLGDHNVITAYDQLAPDHYRCETCNNPFYTHGKCPTLEGEHIVCPGDWIITGIKGEHYPCKPDIFEKTYERVLED